MEERVFNGTIMETNGWFLVDEYSYEYARVIDKYQYDFIRYLWVDSENEGPNKEYIIQIDKVDLGQYTKDELEGYVSTCYDSIATIREEYTKPIANEARELWKIMGWSESELEEDNSWTEEDTAEVIAECVFDESNAYEEEYGVVTEEEAQEIIVDYIRNN